MKKIINISFWEQENSANHVINISKIYENAQEKNLFYVKTIVGDNIILNIFSEYEMSDREYELLFKIYNNKDGFALIIDNKLELETIKYNIIDIY